jgi:hypothetical protein
MRAERGSKPTAADMTRAMIIFRNMLKPLGGVTPYETGSAAKIFPTVGGLSEEADVIGLLDLAS